MERMGEVAVQGDLLVVQFCRPTDCENAMDGMGGEAQRQLMVRERRRSATPQLWRCPRRRY